MPSIGNKTPPAPGRIITSGHDEAAVLSQPYRIGYVVRTRRSRGLEAKTAVEIMQVIDR